MGFGLVVRYYAERDALKEKFDSEQFYATLSDEEATYLTEALGCLGEAAMVFDAVLDEQYDNAIDAFGRLAPAFNQEYGENVFVRSYHWKRQRDVLGLLEVRFAERLEPFFGDVSNVLYPLYRNV